MTRYSFGPYVAASAWTEGDLARLHECIAVLQRYERIRLDVTCPHCGYEIERELRLSSIQDVVKFLERQVGQVGQNATPWFH